MMSLVAAAQSPQLINYQGVTRDNVGNVLANQSIGVQIYIRSGPTTGTIAYQEVHSVSTNELVFFSIWPG